MTIDDRDTTLQPNHKNDSINGPVVMKKDDMDMTLLLTCDNDPKDGNENTEFMLCLISYHVYFGRDCVSGSGCYCSIWQPNREHCVQM